MNESDIKYYKDLIVKKSYKLAIIQSIEIVKRFVYKHKKIIVGGQSIDYALKLKGDPGLYDKDALPDIDIVSDTHYQDAYAIAIQLMKAGISGISVINALHPSTMKVRVDFQEVCDITYIPTNLLEAIPTIWYKGYQITHPHYQYIDQHRSLMYPYENPPFETIMNRPLKDMVRYDKLYEHYPMRIINVKNTNIEFMHNNIGLEVLNRQCITSFVALNYWIKEAKSLGFQTNTNIGSFDIKGSKLYYSSPYDVYGLSLYSDNINSMYKIFEKILEQNSSETHTVFFSRLLDKFPRRVVIGKNANSIEIFDNIQKIAAHSVKFSGSEFHIANLQTIMLYMLVNYVLISKANKERRVYAYYVGYLLCRDLITWASNEYDPIGKNAKDIKDIKRFLPTANAYGENNISDSAIVSQHNFDIKNGNKDISEKLKYSQPKHVYDRDMAYGKIPKKYMEFQISNSEIYNMNGTIVPDFLENS